MDCGCVLCHFVELVDMNAKKYEFITHNGFLKILCVQRNVAIKALFSCVWSVVDV